MHDTVSILTPLLANYRRILVLGSPGSGKSWLSTALADSLNIPIVSMDELYWRAGWQRPDHDTFSRNLVSSLDRPKWILDGNYEESLEMRWSYADAAVYLDMPTWLCLVRTALRGWHRSLNMDVYLPPHLRTDGRKLQLPDPRFVWKVLTFRSRVRQRVLRTLTVGAASRKVVLVSQFGVFELLDDPIVL
jgi:hypothetical protein